MLPALPCSYEDVVVIIISYCGWRMDRIYSSFYALSSDMLEALLEALLEEVSDFAGDCEGAWMCLSVCLSAFVCVACRFVRPCFFFPRGICLVSDRSSERASERVSGPATSGLGLWAGEMMVAAVTDG
eukprot:GHVU01216544.1.p2 GENE.GHVU01216544.1~~GHVU01216544.1.p2  ORF type:complete len:128 (+),score=10.81 GHVU01216544.1:301-684(+)